jgi:predicted DNA-binding antitoxin AbrB/MazE fold protein
MKSRVVIITALIGIMVALAACNRSLSSDPTRNYKDLKGNSVSKAESQSIKATPPPTNEPQNYSKENAISIDAPKEMKFVEGLSAPTAYLIKVTMRIVGLKYSLEKVNFPKGAELTQVKTEGQTTTYKLTWKPTLGQSAPPPGTVHVFVDISEQDVERNELALGSSTRDQDLNITVLKNDSPTPQISPVTPVDLSEGEQQDVVIRVMDSTATDVRPPILKIESIDKLTDNKTTICQQDASDNAKFIIPQGRLVSPHTYEFHVRFSAPAVALVKCTTKANTSLMSFAVIAYNGDNTPSIAAEVPVTIHFKIHGPEIAASARQVFAAGGKGDDTTIVISDERGELQFSEKAIRDQLVKFPGKTKPTMTACTRKDGHIDCVIHWNPSCKDGAITQTLDVNAKSKFNGVTYPSESKIEMASNVDTDECRAQAVAAIATPSKNTDSDIPKPQRKPSLPKTHSTGSAKTETHTSDDQAGVTP